MSTVRMTERGELNNGATLAVWRGDRVCTQISICKVDATTGYAWMVSIFERFAGAQGAQAHVNAVLRAGRGYPPYSLRVFCSDREQAGDVAARIAQDVAATKPGASLRDLWLLPYMHETSHVSYHDWRVMLRRAEAWTVRVQ